MRQRLVVIGNGMAGIRAVEEVLRQAPGRYAITVFGAEPYPAYNRIQLSPVLAGDKDLHDIVIHDRAWYAANGVELFTGTRISGIDRAAREAITESGERFPYDRLIFATGSHPVVLPLPGAGLPGVLAFRDIADVEAMSAAARRGGRAIVIGGGLLGLEAASGLQRQGMSVSVVHLMPSLMERQLDAEAADLLRRELERRGIAIFTSVQTEAILGTDGVTGIRFAEGGEIPADLVVMAVGVRPNADLARAAGLAVERGVIVDDQLRTSDPAIFAVGECVEHRGICHGLVAPLYAMAEALGGHFAGLDAAYVPQPVATRLKVSGIDLFSAGDFVGGADTEDLVLSDPGRGVYRRLVLRGDRLVGAVLYGDAADGPWYFDLLQSGRCVAAMRDDLIFGPAFCAAA